MTTVPNYERIFGADYYKKNEKLIFMRGPLKSAEEYKSMQPHEKGDYLLLIDASLVNRHDEDRKESRERLFTLMGRALMVLLLVFLAITPLTKWISTVPWIRENLLKALIAGFIVAEGIFVYKYHEKMMLLSSIEARMRHELHQGVISILKDVQQPRNSSPAPGDAGSTRARTRPANDLPKV